MALKRLRLIEEQLQVLRKHLVSLEERQTGEKEI